MLSKKLFHLINRIAIFAIVFASLAPSISHAIAAQQGASTFVQEVCTRDGKKITIQVVTTQGQQFETEFSAKDTGNDHPVGIQHHLQHCPFCANPSIDSVIQASSSVIISVLSQRAQRIAAATQAVLPRFSALPPPAHAPPAL